MNRTHRSQDHDVPRSPSVVSRRSLLRGLGAGAAFFAPMLRGWRAQAAGTPPGNLLVFFTPNGHLREQFGATGSGASFTLLPALTPLAPWKAKLSVARDIDNPGGSSKGSHEDCVRNLTCLPGDDIYRGYGPSIDWVVAQAASQTPLTTSSLWPNAPNWQSKISWKSDNVFDPHVNDPKTLFDSLFSGLAPSGNAAQVTAQRAQKKSVLDFVLGDITALQSRLPASQSVKMANHVDAVRQLETQLTADNTATMTTACQPSALSQHIAMGQAGLTGGDGLQRALEIQSDLIATAFACGVKRAATLLTQGASDGINPFGDVGHHDVSHGLGPDPVGTRQKIDNWYATRFAYVLQRLSDLGILDTTMVVWCSEISEDHNQQGFVIPIAGGSALGIAGQQTFTGTQMLSNLWVSVQKALGVAKDTFGAQSSGGLSGLFTPR